MNIVYTKEVNSFLYDFMKEHGFSNEGLDTGLYKNDSKIYKVAYCDETKMFTISVAALDSDGNAGDYNQLSAWLFDEENHGKNDTKCIADDFSEAVAKDSGIKLSTASSTKDVAMPEKAESGTEPGIEAFTQKFLAMFPQYKDAYKEMVVRYGDFLYVEFYRHYGIEKMQELMADTQNNKRQLTKYWKMLGDMHYQGDGALGDLICVVIIAGSFGNNPADFDAAAEKYLAEYPFLKSAGSAAAHNYKTNARLRKNIEAK